MGNRFYIPPQRSQLLDVADLGLRFYGIKKQAESDTARNALMKEDVALRGRVQGETERVNKIRWGENGQPGLEHGQLNATNRQIAVGETRNDLERQKLELMQKTEEANFNLYMTQQPNPARLLGVVEKMPSLKAPVNGLIEEINAGNVKTRWEAYRHLKSNWATLSQVAKDELAKEIQKDIKEGRHLTAAQKGEMLNEINSDGFVEQIFGFPQSMMPKRERVNMPVGSTAEPRLYETEDGYLPAGEALGKKKPEKASKETLKALSPGQVLVDAEGNVVARGPEKASKETSLTEQRQIAKDVAKAEETIIGNIDNAQAQPHVDLFNQYAGKPYSYIWKEKKGTKILGMTFGEGGEAVKIPLPVINGKQVTARDVYDTAAQEGLTYEEVLRLIGAIADEEPTR